MVKKKVFPENFIREIYLLKLIIKMIKNMEQKLNIMKMEIYNQQLNMKMNMA